MTLRYLWAAVRGKKALLGPLTGYFCSWMARVFCGAQIDPERLNPYREAPRELTDDEKRERTETAMLSLRTMAKGIKASMGG